MALLALMKGKGPSGFGYGSTAEDVTAGLSLSGKNYLVTGCNSGLGQETLRVLKLRGAHVVGLARTVDKARAAGADTSVACDLAEVGSIRASVAAVKTTGLKLHGIFCNAGIMALPKLEQAYGIELQLFTNHVGPFMLVTGLLDALAEDGRVVVTSSDLHTAAPKGGIEFDNLGGDKGYRPQAAYGQSKFANILFAKALSQRLQGTGKTANALHPGVIRTNLSRHMNPLFSVAFAIADPLVLKTVGQGAATQTFVGTHPSQARVSGEYFADCNVARPRPDANDPQLAERLWRVSEEVVAGLPR